MVLSLSLHQTTSSLSTAPAFNRECIQSNLNNGNLRGPVIYTYIRVYDSRALKGPAFLQLLNK